MFAVINVKTGHFYSESPVLEKYMRKAGLGWKNSSPYMPLAQHFKTGEDAQQKAKALSNGKDDYTVVEVPGKIKSKVFQYIMNEHILDYWREKYQRAMRENNHVQMWEALCGLRRESGL